MTTRERVERQILACFDEGWEPHPREVAEVLVDQDVSRGEYEGCSTELEIAYTEYERFAGDALATKGGGR